jgi:hypothetical protein
LFERATRYRERQSSLAQPQDSPNYGQSGVAFLDELDSAPHGVIDSLLNVMSEGVVQTRGVGPQQIQIGCAIVFASIKGEDLLLDEQTLQRGSGALSAFFERIPNRNRIRLPSLKELGMLFALKFLSFKAGREIVLQPAAADLLEEGIKGGNINIRELAMMRIPKSFRVTYQEVKDVFDDQPGTTSGVSQHGGLQSAPPNIETAQAWAWLDAIQSACTKILTSGERLSKESVGRNLISPKSGKSGVSPQRISQIFNSEDFSTTLHQLLENHSDRWPDVKEII